MVLAQVTRRSLSIESLGMKLQFTIHISFRTALLQKLFDIRFSNKYCNFLTRLRTRHDGFQNRDYVRIPKTKTQHNNNYSQTSLQRPPWEQKKVAIVEKQKRTSA